METIYRSIRVGTSEIVPSHVLQILLYPPPTPELLFLLFSQCLHTHTNAHKYTYTHTHKHRHTQTYTYINISTYANTYTQAHTYTHEHIYTNTHVYVPICKYICTHTCVFVHKQAHIQTLLHTTDQKQTGQQQRVKLGKICLAAQPPVHASDLHIRIRALCFSRASRKRRGGLL